MTAERDSAFMLPQHAKLIKDSAIAPEIARARGYRTVTVKSELDSLGFSRQQQRVPALLLPVWNAKGEMALYQARPDEPRVKDGKPLKYETPAGCGMVIDVPPAARARIGDPATPLFITEGIRKADAAVSAGLFCVDLLGVWNWRGRNEQGGATALPDWEYLALKGRKVYIVFDSDVMEKPAVHSALARLKAFLEDRGAESLAVYLPPTAGGGKQGLDDFLAAGGSVHEMLTCARMELRPLEKAGAPSIPYRETPNGLLWMQPSRDGDIPRMMTNFTARIHADIAKDDGAEITREFEIEACRAGRRTRFAVPAAQFASLNWVTERLGASAIVYPGNGLRDHARAAIQILSGEVPERIVYAHTGWRQIAGEWAYLHAGGAIGASGPLDGVETALGGLERYSLPDPPDMAGTRDAIRCSLRFLDVAERGQSWPLLAAVFLAPLAPFIRADFVLWVQGSTQARKSTITALALGHYGTFERTHLPANFLSTGNALELLAFAAKDALLVIDDFNPQADSQVAAQQDAAAHRLIRGVGDTHGRIRATADAHLRAEKPPRCLAVVTAELPPPGAQSTAARTLEVTWKADAVDLVALTRAQREDALLYPLTLSAYLRWLAPQYEALQTDLPNLLASLRDAFATCPGIGHARTAENAAKLTLGAAVFLRFAVEAGGISETEALTLACEAADVVFSCARVSSTAQTERKPTTLFFEYLGAMLAQGAAYIADRDTGEAPLDAARWGYQTRAASYGAAEPPALPAPGAEKIGWIDQATNQVYLIPAAVHRAVTRYTQAANVRFPVGRRTLAEHLKRDGFLEREGPSGTEVQFRAEGRGGLRAWCVPAAAFYAPLCAEETATTTTTATTEGKTQQPRHTLEDILRLFLSRNCYKTATETATNAPVAVSVAVTNRDLLQTTAQNPAPLLDSSAPVAVVADAETHKGENYTSAGVHSVAATQKPRREREL
ncbi:MAG TPA: DUF3854 domain-containing protein [Armatimonadota bacterium]|nr:DUF3854 domain-containing protein [Armatimonadota bacterium]